jgi:two-component system sensor histidine kinase KdpD
VLPADEGFADVEESLILRGQRCLPLVDRMSSPAVPASPASMLRRARRWMHGWATASGALAIATLVCALIESYFEPANLITVYLAGVVFVALRKGRGAALFTVVGSILLFDLLFVAPRWSLKPTDPQYFFTFAVTLFVGLIISHLAANARQEKAAVEARSRRTQALNQLALQLAKARTGDAVAAALEATVGHALGVHAQLIPVDEDGLLTALDQAFAQDRGAAEQALRERRETGAGTAVEAEADRRYIPLLATDCPLGVLAVERMQAEHDKPEDDDLLKAIANQAAVALERAVFEQRGARAAVEAERERLRSTLLAGISHDFRTPLTTIVGSATSLLEQRDAIDEVHRDALLRGVLLEAQRMHALTSDLLDLTRMEAGAVRPNPEWCPADELVDEARAALGARLACHRIHVEVDDEAVVWCDARLLGQALVNLLDNAIRHTPAGTSISVGVKVGSGAWSLVVHDDGPGIPAGQEREVFKKFFRGWQEPDSRGTGLGLAICAVVAELHRGTIVAQNDNGARFEMSLPQPDDSSARLREAE